MQVCQCQAVLISSLMYVCLSVYLLHKDTQMILTDPFPTRQPSMVTTHVEVIARRNART